MTDDLIGKQLGQYEIKSKLGEGGMATVYRALQPSIGREVAVKVLPANFMSDPNFLERFKREVKLIATLQHPRILPVYDYGQADGLPYIVMAYMPGGSLADKIKESGYGLPVTEVIHLLGQIGEALDFAHRKGIIHRDFKPANVLLDNDGNTYLADFGIARAVEKTSELTGTGLVGTPAYMAPEMADTGIPGNSVDIYALGVTLYQMLTGKVPYSSTNPMGVLMMHLNQPIPDVTKRRPDLPPGVQRVIEKAMAKDPAGRYQTASEIAPALYNALLGGVDNEPAAMQPTAVGMVSAPAEETQIATGGSDVLEKTLIEKSKKKSFPWVAVIGILVVLAAAAGFYFFGGGDELVASLIPAEEEVTMQPAADDPTPAQEPASEPESTATTEPAEPTEAAAIEPTAAPTDEPTPTPSPEPTPLGGGGRILFVSAREGTALLYLMDWDGANLNRLSEPGASYSDPAWSPDGTQIAYTFYDGSNRDIWIMDADGSNPRQITTSPGDDYHPDWSPDGTQIVFTSQRDGNPEIYLMQVDGSRQFRLTNNFFTDDSPVFSPDGAHILFVSTVDGDQELWMIDANGANPYQLTKNQSYELEPAWSSDGSRILFSSNQSGNFDIYSMKADGTDIVQITVDTSWDGQAVYSADGQWVIFVSDRDGNREIYIVGTEGGIAQRLTDHLADDISPEWGGE